MFSEADAIALLPWIALAIMFALGFIGGQQR